MFTARAAWPLTLALGLSTLLHPDYVHGQVPPPAPPLVAAEAAETAGPVGARRTFLAVVGGADSEVMKVFVMSVLEFSEGPGLTIGARVQAGGELELFGSSDSGFEIAPLVSWRLEGPGWARLGVGPSLGRSKTAVEGSGTDCSLLGCLDYDYETRIGLGVAAQLDLMLSVNDSFGVGLGLSARVGNPWSQLGIGAAISFR